MVEKTVNEKLDTRING